MAISINRLNFSKSWKSSTDFPTKEATEAQVREDMQWLHDETRNYINDSLLPTIYQLSDLLDKIPESAGDMLRGVYDPLNRGGTLTTPGLGDVYTYADRSGTSALNSAKTYTDTAVEGVRKVAYRAELVGKTLKLTTISQGGK